MKKARKFIIATFIATVTMGLGSTLAWLVPLAKFGPEDKLIDGATEGAYYAYGEGTAEQPFGISNPRHLYNLSWLQYLGMYSNGQYYFELASDIEDGVLDMNDWVIPPIGTEENPFIGNFNGNGQIIENLVVSNDFTEYNRYPSVVSQNGFELARPQVVGFFGVIGDLNDSISYVDYDSDINEFKNTGLSSITVRTVAAETLVGVAAGYSDANILNVAVESPTIDIDDDNASAYSSSLTENLSDYGVVGYTTKKGEISKIDEKLYGVNVENAIQFNAQADGVDDGWGGSINMKTIFERLRAIKVRIAQPVTDFGWRENKNYYNGVLDSSETSRNSLITQFETDANYRLVNYSHTEAGNFNYFDRGTSSDSYMYLVGGHDEIRNYYTNNSTNLSYITDGTNYLRFTGSALQNTTTFSQATAFNFELQSGNVYYITTSSGGQTYYLYNNASNALQIATTGWTQAQRQWTITTTGNNLTIVNNNRRIMYTSNAWQMIATATTVYEEKRTIKYSGGNNWMGPANSGAAVSSVTSASSAVSFEVDSDGYIYYKVGSTNRYLALYITTGWNATVELRYNDNKNATNYFYATYSQGQIVLGRENYFVRYNNSIFTYGDSTNTNLIKNFNVETNVYSTVRTKYLKNYFQNSANATESTEKSKMYYTAGDTTYFPLNVNQDGGTFSTAAQVNSAIANGNFSPKDTNTGYIISGADLKGQTYYTKDRSVIRVSQYAFSSINNSMSSSDDSKFEDLLDSKILTVKVNPTTGALTSSNMDGHLSDDYPRYADSKYSLYMNALTFQFNQTTRRTNEYIFGLHFMDSVVSMDHIVDATNVNVMGVNYPNYQLPVNSVDFNLKQKGSVNFFAGTYFPNNNSIFSLHQVFREGTDIAEMKEIDEIYSNDEGTKTTKYANIYKYKDGTILKPYRYDSNQNKYEMDPYSNVDSNVPYVEGSTITQAELDSYKSTYDYTLRFKTSQIGVRSVTSKALYYFEFPMNSGEYALGSVPGGTGSYLLYLDIGANAAKTQRSIFYEHYQEVIRTYEYPLGVAIVKASTVNNSGVVDPTDTTNMVIEVGSYGTLSIIRDDLLNEVALVRSNGMITHAHPTLIGDLMWDDDHVQYRLSDPGNNLDEDDLNDEIVCEEITRDIRRVQFVDYNVNMETITITQITDISTDGGASYTRTLYQEVVGGGYLEDSQADSMQIFTNTGTKYQISELRDQYNFHTYASGGVNNDLMVHLYIIQPNGVTLDWVVNLEYVTDPENSANGVYYTFGDYLIEFTISGGSITISIIDAGLGVVVVGGSTISAPGGSITVAIEP